MFWETLLVGFHVVVAAVLIGFVLLQHGKGADMGAAFGSGSSGSLFGAVGSANFLSRTTGVLATVFFVTSLGLTYFAGMRASSSATGANQGVMQHFPTNTAPAPAGTPATPGAARPATPAPADSALPKAPDSKAGEIPK